MTTCMITNDVITETTGAGVKEMKISVNPNNYVNQNVPYDPIKTKNCHSNVMNAPKGFGLL